MEHQSRSTNIITGDKKEKGVRRENLAALGKEEGERFGELPDLPLQTAPKSGRIHDDTIILSAAPRFTTDKLQCILNDPANRIVRQPARPLIFFGPIDSNFRRIEMSDVCAGLCGGERSNAGICEEIKYLHLALF